MTVSRTAIKFCGLTCAQDVEAAVALGVDYIGLVMAEGSPRRLTIERAAKLADIARSAVGGPAVVALLRDASAELVKAVVSAIKPDYLQFHGSEAESFCAAFGVPYWKAVGMTGNAGTEMVATVYPTADALLLDAHEPGGSGGTGQVFDWRRWPRSTRRLVLAGGLHSGNVAAAIHLTRPFAVDVSTGIESAPGIKDPARMRAFVGAVRSTDSLLHDNTL